MNEKKVFRNRINDQIRISPVLLIGENGDKLGIKNLEEAKKLARESGLDLVEIAPTAKPPVCRIMDYGKFKYEENLKQKENKKKQKITQIKELRLSPSIGEHDLNTKINAASRFLEDKMKVQLRLKFERRELLHKEIGFAVIKKVLDLLAEKGVPTMSPKMQGDCIVCLLEPKLEGSTK